MASISEMTFDRNCAKWLNNMHKKYTHKNRLINAILYIWLKIKLYFAHGVFTVNGIKQKNLITNAGKSMLANAIIKNRGFKLTHCWVTSNNTTPAASDSTANFCDQLTDFSHMRAFEAAYALNASIDLTALYTEPEANFDIYKIGVLATVKNSKQLFAEQLRTITTKTNTTNMKINYRIEF